MNFRADSPRRPLLFLISAFGTGITASQRCMPASITPDEVAEFAVCRTATAISLACAAVNNHLRDKPLDLWRGRLRKGFRAKMGYEINDRRGWRCSVCLHAASKPSELARMNDGWDTSAVLFNQYCNFFLLSLDSFRKNR